MARVIIVDDASFMRGSLEFIINNAGHQVIGKCKDGQESIKLIKELNPDIVTMDILMKGMDGISALRMIKEQFPDVKVIMVSALGQEAKQEEAKKLGASGYIRKPFKQKEIVEEIENALKCG